MSTLTSQQVRAIESDGSAFLVGSAGTGKTTVLMERMKRLLASGESAYTILILVADPQQREQFVDSVQRAGIGAYSDLNVRHFSQLAREMVILFWPLVARDGGFASGFQPPTFLGYDLAQLLMWRIVEPMIEGGAFTDLRRRPQQIVSQLLDTLNRAALNRLDVMEATEKQISTWSGEPDHVRNLRLAQQAAQAFRQHCLDNNLLDLSLTIDTFVRQVMAHHEFSRYFSERFKHLMVDNLEEQTPAGQAFVERLLNVTESATIVYDEGGGYRRFLAADPIGANRFRFLAKRVFEFGSRFVASAELDHLSTQLGNLLQSQTVGGIQPSEQPLPIQSVIHTRYRREMLVAVARQLRELMDGEQVAAKDIAIVVPYLDSALRYTLTQALKEEGISMNIVRRRASPRDEPRVRAWLTWVALAHPDWGVFPTEYDVAEALELSIDGLDPARAALLAASVYPAGSLQLLSAENLPDLTSQRVGSELIDLYETLRLWLVENGGQHSLDHFLYKLFSDVLATRAFQPEPDVAAAGVLDWLVKTAVYLVDSAEALNLPTPADIGNAFLTSINKGLITSQPPEMGDPPDPNGVLISTIYGYLLRGQPVRHQVWLETAASGWWDIPRQPLSNAFVLAASYDAERMWTMAEEIDIRNQLLTRIVRGLTARCGEAVILATSDLDRRGQRQDGTLWRAFNALGVGLPDIAAADEPLPPLM